MAKTIYDIIKKQNGEGFVRVLRDRCLLDIPNIEHIVKYAGHTDADAQCLFTYLWSLKKFDENDAQKNADPFKLLDMAGYHAFEVHNLKEQNSIERFFREGEKLCTFDQKRYQKNYIIHAIKHEVWRNPHAIKPSKKPQRQDEYGTSVISIQIAKGGGFISIKNRYNHHVDFPDQTFNSNPDEIIAGLSAALKRYFNVDWKSTGGLPGGFILFKDQILKTEFEIMNYYFGDGFYTDHGDIINIDKRNQVQMDYFVWDNQKNKLLNPSNAKDSFVDVFNKFVQGKKVTISGKSPNQTFIVDGIEAVKLENNQIVSLNLPGVTEIGDDFLGLNKSLRHLSLPDVETIGNGFLWRNKMLESISLPKARIIGNHFLSQNELMREISLPSAIKIGNEFMYENEILEKILLPRAELIGFEFLYHNKKLTEISLPQAKCIDFSPLFFNKKIKNVFMPLIEQITETFLRSNNQANLYMPNLNLVITDVHNRHVKPAINVPITDIFPDRRNIAQHFKYAARKIHKYIRTAYHTISDYEI